MSREELPRGHQHGGYGPRHFTPAPPKGKRRRKGDGSVYWSASKRLWIGEYTKDGKARSVSGQNHAQVEARLAKLRGYWHAGQDDMRWLLTEWLEHVRRNPGIKPTTYRGYRTIVEKDLLRWFGRKKPHEVTREDVMGWLDVLAVQGFAENTRRNKARVLSVAFSWAIDQKYVHVNPVTKLGFKSGLRMKLPEWDQELLEQVLDAVEGSKIEDLIHLLTGTGMRLGEALALDWAQVKLGRNPVLFVRATVTRTADGKYTTGRPKTDDSARDIDLHPQLAERLRRRHERMGKPKTGWLFPAETDSSRFVYPTEPTKVFQRLLQRSSLPRLRIHDLRHIAASRALAAGLEVQTVATLLGHSTAVTTWQAYAKVPRGRLRVAVGALATDDRPERRPDEGKAR